MLTTRELVERLRSTTETGSKYSVAKALGVKPPTVDDWLKKSYVMNDTCGLKAAEILHIQADYVLTCLQAERAKGSPSARQWRHIAQRLTPPEMRDTA